MKGNGEYFAQVRDALVAMPGVRSVRVNPRTESILIEHEVPVEPLLRAAEARGHLQLAREPERDRGDPYLARIGRALQDSDRRMREATGGRIDWDTLVFLGLLAGGVYQVARRHALPAGVTLFGYAIEMVTSAAKAQRNASAAAQS